MIMKGNIRTPFSLLMPSGEILGNNFISEKSIDVPSSYVTDEELYETFKQGKVLTHKQDF